MGLKRVGLAENSSQTESYPEERECSPERNKLKRILTGVSLIILGALLLIAGVTAHTVQFLRYLDIPQVFIIGGLILLAIGGVRLSPGLAQKLNLGQKSRRGRRSL